jgi:hypothetical protein
VLPRRQGIGAWANELGTFQYATGLYFGRERRRGGGSEDDNPIERASQELALAEFRLRLAGLNAEEVRLMLERRRDRSPERVAMAHSRLADLERAARTPPQARLDGLDAGRQVAPMLSPDGAAAVALADSKKAAIGIGGKAVTVAGQVRRLLGIGLGTRALTAVALRIVRR